MKLKEYFLIFILSVAFVAGNKTEIKVVQCGASVVGRGNIVGGEDTKIHSWPWLVALIQKPKNDFFCSGSLISAKYVISGEQVL
jgi:secreted trypsin-like serine protease